MAEMRIVRARCADCGRPYDIVVGAPYQPSGCKDPICTQKRLHRTQGGQRMERVTTGMTAEQCERLSDHINDKGWDTDVLKAFAYKLFGTEGIFNLPTAQAEELIRIAARGPEYYMVGTQGELKKGSP